MGIFSTYKISSAPSSWFEFLFPDEEEEGKMWLMKPQQKSLIKQAESSQARAGGAFDNC